MATVVDVADRPALERLVRTWLEKLSPFSLDGIVRVTAYGFDARINWDTHIVTVDGFGPVGFTDGSCD